jgi:hypothetical protein
VAQVGEGGVDRAGVAGVAGGLAYRSERGRAYRAQYRVVRAERALTRFSPGVGTVAFTTRPRELPDGGAGLLDGCYQSIDGPSTPMWWVYAPSVAQPVVPWDRWWGAIEAVVFVHGRREAGRPERLVSVYAWLQEVVVAEEQRPALTLAENGSAGGGTGGEVAQAKSARTEDVLPASFPMVLLRARVYELPTYAPGTTRRLLYETPVKPYDPIDPDPNGFVVPRYPVRDWRHRSVSRPADVSFTGFFGTLDPQDESRIIVRYNCAGQAGVIAGRLGSDDSVGWVVEIGPRRRPLNYVETRY